MKKRRSIKVIEGSPDKKTAEDQVSNTSVNNTPLNEEEMLSQIAAIFGGTGYSREVEDESQYQLYLKVKDRVSKEAEKRYLEENGLDTPRLGSCHGIWAIEKRIYKEEYGIDWHTPQEMNTGISFD